MSDRPTPNADIDPDYRAYIAATEGAAFQTQRIRAEDLAALRKASRSSASKLTPLAALAPPAPPAAPAAPAAPVASAPAPLPSSFRPTSAPVPVRRRSAAWPLALFLGAAAAGGVWGWKHRAQVVAAVHAVARAKGAPRPTGAPATTPATSASSTAVSATSPTSDAPAAATSTPAATASAEADARHALERFRAGFAACVRGIRGLPGSSPIVPAPLASLHEGPLAAPPAAWKTAVWSCAHFQIDEPMRYALQWQLVRPGVEGMAVVWYDVGQDGRARGALGFRAKMGAYGPPEVGEIVPLPASRPVVLVR